MAPARPSRLAPLALAALLPACWVPLQRGREMEARLDQLEAGSRDTAERLEAQQKRSRDTLAALDKKLAEAQAKLDELNVAARRSGADLGVSVQRLQDDVTKLQGELEVQRHDLQKLDEGLAAYRDRTDKRFAGLAGKGALDEALARERLDALPRNADRATLQAAAQKAEADGEKGVARALYDEVAARFPRDPAAPEAVFRSAELLAGLQRPRDAVARFRDVYTTWPSAPNAAEAAFRSGQLLAGEGRWRDALVAYGWVYERAPRSERAPAAMLGMADAMLELDELKQDARVVLEELVQKYPRSEAAAEARERLAKLAPKQAAKPAEPKRKPAPAAPAAKPAQPKKK